MLRVRCMKGWLGGRPLATWPSPNELEKCVTGRASISLVVGPNSTTRQIEPLVGGGMPILRALWSAVTATSAGVESVTHTRPDSVSLAVLRFQVGDGPSISTIALPLASWPVTTRLTGLFISFPSLDEFSTGDRRPGLGLLGVAFLG